MPAAETFYLQSNVPGGIAGFSVMLISSGENGDNVYEVTLCSTEGAVKMALTSRFGFSLDGLNWFKLNAKNVDIVGDKMSLQGSSVTITGQSTIVKAAGDLQLGGDTNAILSAVKRLLLFGLHISLRAIASITVWGVNVALKATGQITMNAPFIRMNGQVIMGQGARGVARLGDKVFIPGNGTTPPMTGTIISASSKVLAG